MTTRNSTPIWAAVLVSCVWSTASATVYTVDAGGGGDFLTIQEGVDAAAPGDTLLIAPGVYYENVVSVSKRLSYVGAGPGLTRVVGIADAPTIDLHDTSGHSVFRDITVEKYPPSTWAVHWNTGLASFYGSEVVGKAGGESHYGQIHIWDSIVESVEITSAGSSSITSSSIGTALIAGYWEWWGGGEYCYGHLIETSGSDIGHLTVACGSHLESNGDVFGSASASEFWDSVSATDSRFGSISMGSGDLKLRGCEVLEDVDVDASMPCSESRWWDLRISDCLVLGDLNVLFDLCGSPYQFSCLRLCHNTIVGDLNCEMSLVGDCEIYPYRVRSNIVGGETVLEALESWYWVVVTHNDFVGGWTLDTSPDSTFANFSLPPLFCDASGGDYQLQDCSPCVGAAHDGADVGAFGVGCPCLSVVQETTWGRIKSLYRQPSN